MPTARDDETTPTNEPVGTASAAETVVPEGHDSPDLLDPAVLAAETELAGVGLSPEERLKQAFPGAQEV